MALKSVWFPSRTIHPPPPARDTEPKEKHDSLCIFWAEIMRNPYRETSTGAQLPSPPRPVWSGPMHTSHATVQHRAAPLLRDRAREVHLTGGAAWRRVPNPARDTEPKENHDTLCLFSVELMWNPYQKSPPEPGCRRLPVPLWSVSIISLWRKDLDRQEEEQRKRKEVLAPAAP